MHDHSSSTLTALDNVMDGAVLSLLVTDRPGLWTIEEVEREIGRPAAYDSIARLVGAGLAHRLAGDDRFVFASRAGGRGFRLET
jgi:hypothetical protein